MWIATSEHCKSVDRRATEEFGIPASVLMERAGLAVFEAVRQMLPNPGKICVVCGRGNNGGDGLVTARLAAERKYEVEVLVAAEESQLSPEATYQLAITRAQGVQPVFYDSPKWKRKADCIAIFDIVVDALLGTGAKCEVKGPIKDAIQAINRSGVPVVAVDVPSGIHCDTGEELGESVWACRTVTFGFPKPFLFEGLGIEHSGYWTVTEIGFPSALLHETTEARLVEDDWVANLLPDRLRGCHKGDNGHVLIVGGSRCMPGAPAMAAEAALRSGAGLVTVASIPSVLQSVAANLPEALLLPLPENDGAIAVEASDILADRQHVFAASSFGPGMTHVPQINEFLSKTFAAWRIPTVIDADALTALTLGVPLPDCEVVLTPHAGEMSRLLHNSVAEIQADRFQAVRDVLARWGRCAILKGPYSIVGEPDQCLLVNTTGNPGMAAGGMGDVLSGVVATLLGQNLPPYYAASCAAYWHGLAGDLCANEVGPIGYTARDVSAKLPRARAKILEICCDDCPS